MRIIWWGVVLVLGLTGLATAMIYILSEQYLSDVEQPEPFTQSLTKDINSLAQGRHIARTRGCFGCHGQQLEGRVFEEWPWVKRAVAPNLAVYGKEHNVATLEAAIRHGIGQDGRALWSMPSYNYRHLSDDDVMALIAYLQAAEVIESDLPEPALGLRARLAMARGNEEHMAAWVADVPQLTVDAKEFPQLARGEYLAMTTCNECHGLDLRGDVQPDFTTPDLIMVTAYSLAQFQKLMREGEAIGGRKDLGLMTVVAKDRFAYFTEQEVIDLYAFLNSLAE